jgi:hypothetical protein
MAEQSSDVRGMGEPFSAVPKVQWPFITTVDGPKTLVQAPAPSAPTKSV